MSLWKAEQFRPNDDQEAQEARAKTAAPEWLDRHPWLPIIFLILLPFLVELPLLFFGLSTNPIWQQSGIVEGVKAGLLPGLSYGDPNVGWTTQALGHLAAEDWLHGTIPWWNPYSGIGLPLAGEMQPNAFFLPFVFLLLLHNGVLWLKIAIQIMAGLATFALLRELNLGRVAALTGGALYALNGTFAWLPGPVAVINTIPFLPLLLYGIERARKTGDSDGIIWIALAIAGSLYAGFPEAAYINGLLALSWFIYRLVLDDNKSRFMARVMLGGALGLLSAMPLLVAFGDYIIRTNAFSSHGLGTIRLPPQALSSIIFPYVYGPEADSFGSSFLSAIWGNMGGYAGALLIIFALFAYQIKSYRGFVYLLYFWIIIALAKSFGVQPVMLLMNHIPFLHDTAFYRYSPPSWEMAIVILVAITMDNISKQRLRIYFPLLGTITLLGLAIYMAWPWRTVWNWSHAQAIKMSALLGIALFWAALGLLAVVLAWFCSNKKHRRWILSTILILDSAILFMIPELSGIRLGRIDKPAVNFLSSHLGLQRFYTLGPLEPNYSAYFDIASINHNYLPIASNWANYLDENIFPQLPKSSGVIFWAPWYGSADVVIDFVRFSRNYEALGVRYVITSKGQSLLPSVSFPTASHGNTPLLLGNDASVTVKLNLPKKMQNNASVSAVSVFQGNYGNTANGNLTVKVCTGTNDCAIGARPLSQSSDNSSFSIPLKRPLQVKAGEALTITFTHIDSTKPEALWLWPQAPDDNQTVIGPRGAVSGKAIQLSLETADSALQGLRKVYSDALLDIWELPHPAPYYTVLHGNCSLSKETRDAVVAQCSTPSTLLRRELYMPGWSATVNGSSVAVSAHDEIFQTIPLGIGENVVHFQFSPPYIDYAWIALFLGLIGLLWQSKRAFLQSRFLSRK